MAIYFEDLSMFVLNVQKHITCTCTLALEILEKKYGLDIQA